MVNKIGIDAGGSLVKLAYFEQGRLHTKTFSNQHLAEIGNWLSVLSMDTELFVTGGKASMLENVTNQKVHYIDEFQAVTTGTKYLLKDNKLNNDEFILVNIGTGTSIFHVTENAYERVLGSGIGGGTLMGLGYLISKTHDFQNLTSMAARGDARNSDLLVRDIYYPKEPPIYGDLTAANLGKAHLNKEASSDDHLASVMQLIGETILLLANQVATSKQVPTIVFVGGTVTNNPTLKNVFERFQNIMTYTPIFLEKGSHAGAIGALLEK
ncbi:type II pantothenate kinase [Ornithinibacillus halotolerans]|uniref:Type II pantothenate kinase n=1 Tax=Ornithinibacillus halotolerans TaxID=1274357 RepID=A0A916S8V4_9BACI|nr:type II pantothenate kinase [Ornithinibacillus halotolerans]GGA87372.1 type II pantothenate kinase [Ornithinibacillus halotolerans]